MGDMMWYPHAGNGSEGLLGVFTLRQRRIALLIETSRAYGRGLLRGIASYARLRSDWVVTHHERGLEEAPPPWLADWSGDGVIARIETDALAEAIGQLGLPVVDLRGRHRLQGTAALDTDPVAVAEMGFNHLVERGFDHLAFCGYPGLNFSDARGSAFVGAAERQQRTTIEYLPPPQARSDTHVLAREAQGEEDNQLLARWVAELPKPVGVMACNDERGRQVLRACDASGLDVPSQVAVIGVDNDEVVCDLAEPPLSSVEPATHEMGFRGAELLDRMIDGEPAPEDVLLIAPARTEERRSTDVIATDDPHAAAALRFIRNHACDGINVADVLDHLMISRATLERHFMRVAGRTPKEYITYVRITHVKRLLRSTAFALPTIAQHTGFATHTHMATVFHKETGQTPGQYRRRA